MKTLSIIGRINTIFYIPAPDIFNKTMMTSIGNILHNKDRILIVPNQENDIDSLFAALALAQSLCAISKDVSVYISKIIDKKPIIDHISKQDFHIVDITKLKQTVITIQKFESEISDIQWTVTDGDLDIYLNTLGKNISLDQIVLKAKRQDYGAIVYLNVSKPEDLGEFNDIIEPKLTPEKVILINGTITNSIFNNHFEVTAPTMSQAIYSFLKTFKLPLDKKSATLLLSGMYWGTNNFQHSTNKKTFYIASMLSKQGGDIAMAKSTSGGKISFVQSKYISLAFSNVNVANEGIYYSVIKKRSLNEKFLANLPKNNMVPISIIDDFKAGFVIIERAGYNKVYMQSNSSDINLVPILINCEGEGTEVKGSFKSKSSPSDLIAMLTKRLGKGEEVKSSKAVKPKIKPIKSGKKIIKKKINAKPVIRPTTKKTETKPITSKVFSDPLTPAIKLPEAYSVEKKKEQVPQIPSPAIPLQPAE